jgi:hypothetical protein
MIGSDLSDFGAELVVEWTSGPHQIPIGIEMP